MRKTVRLIVTGKDKGKLVGSRQRSDDGSPAKNRGALSMQGNRLSPTAAGRSSLRRSEDPEVELTPF